MCGGHLGRLKYFEVARMFKPQGFSHLKIWALQDYTSNNWYLKHIVRKEEIMVDNNLGSSPYVNLASFHPYDEDIVYLEWSQEVVSYNTRTRRVEALGGAQQKTLDTAPWSCLVLPIWPVSIPTSLYLSIGAGGG
ncbi:hypothetical protein ACH5RR_038117 [Cinchona calisaya]|uniref:Uncharacterized protein n=1 Tax=Cinchona calisaya TaxID=153742 RepID=A0ABD2Y852_9GENT